MDAVGTPLTIAHVGLMMILISRHRRCVANVASDSIAQTQTLAQLTLTAMDATGILAIGTHAEATMIMTSAQKKCAAYVSVEALAPLLQAQLSKLKIK